MGRLRKPLTGATLIEGVACLDTYAGLLWFTRVKNSSLTFLYPKLAMFLLCLYLEYKRNA